MPPLSSCEAISSRPDWTDTCRSVRFDDDVCVHDVPCISEEEKIDRWMGKADYMKIRQDCFVILQLAMNNSMLDSSDLRGLEYKTPQGIYRRQRNRMDAVRAVLDEQAFQSRTGFSDPEWLASVYKENTHRCHIEAKIMGMRDEVAIKRYVQGSRDTIQSPGASDMRCSVPEWCIVNKTFRTDS